MRALILAVLMTGCIECESLPCQCDDATESSYQEAGTGDEPSFQVATENDYEEACDEESGLCWSRPIPGEYWPYNFDLIEPTTIPHLEEMTCLDYFGNGWRLVTREEFHDAARRCVFSYYATETDKSNHDPFDPSCATPFTCELSGEYEECPSTLE